MEAKGPMVGGNTIITFTAADRTARIWTSQEKIHRRLERKGYVALVEGKASAAFIVPKDAIAVRATSEMKGNSRSERTQEGKG